MIELDDNVKLSRFRHIGKKERKNEKLKIEKMNEKNIFLDVLNKV